MPVPTINKPVTDTDLFRVVIDIANYRLSFVQAKKDDDNKLTLEAKAEFNSTGSGKVSIQKEIYNSAKKKAYLEFRKWQHLRAQ